VHSEEHKRRRKTGVIGIELNAARLNGFPSFFFFLSFLFFLFFFLLTIERH